MATNVMTAKMMTRTSEPRTNADTNTIAILPIPRPLVSRNLGWIKREIKDLRADEDQCRDEPHRLEHLYDKSAYLNDVLQHRARHRRGRTSLICRMKPIRKPVPTRETIRPMT